MHQDQNISQRTITSAIPPSFLLLLTAFNNNLKKKNDGYHDENFISSFKRTGRVSTLKEPFGKPMENHSQNACRQHYERPRENGTKYRTTVTMDFLQ